MNSEHLHWVWNPCLPVHCPQLWSNGDDDDDSVQFFIINVVYIYSEVANDTRSTKKEKDKKINTK
jgi:hypothetical protein